MSGAEIREGFLCPICMKDLFTLTQLTDHFESAHANEDKQVLQQLKGFFAKTKKKILTAIEDKEETSANDGSQKTTSSSSNDPVGGIDPTMWETQTIGQTRSYTDYFKPIRDERIDRYVVETNKLLIRLDKLIGPDVPFESGKRKAYEKAIVPWAPDSHVKLCMTCGSSFSLMKRRHHCRLCGGIMCDKCSHFLPFTFAKQLLNPTFDNEPCGFLRRSGSNSSLNSMMNPEGEPHVRSCLECRKILERRNHQVEQQNQKQPIVEYYEKMRRCIEEADKGLPDYMTMAESLRNGEATYGLPEAQASRERLSKLFQTIDLISKKIATLGMNNEDQPPPPSVCKLQSSIRQYTTSYLQLNSFGLLPLPNEKELKALQEARQAEIQRRIMLERKQLAEAQERERRQEEEKLRRQQQNVKPVTKERTNSGSVPKSGWQPQEVSADLSSTDPMIQQINIIKGYIKQARHAQKWDEVEMLEMNLKDLQTEYYKEMGQGFKGTE